jgi:beta-glucanase (GH16 family)
VIPDLIAAQSPPHNGKKCKRFEPAFPIRSVIENFGYRCRMSWLRSVNKQSLYRGRKLDLDSYCRLSFEDGFDTFNRNKWRIGQPWGNIHPGHAYQWYSDSGVKADSGLLKLRAFYSPRQMPLNGKDTLVPYQVGLICSDISFSTIYGYFELRCKLPSGPVVWPAFWLAPVQGWPPEIDIFEMYGKSTGHGIHRLTNSLHFGSIEAGNKRQRIYGIRLPPNTDKRFYVYSCLWTPTCIEFYVNGYKVRRVRLNHTLAKAFHAPMYMIINNGLQELYLRQVGMNLPESTLELDYVRVYTLGDM